MPTRVAKRFRKTAIISEVMKLLRPTMKRLTARMYSKGFLMFLKFAEEAFWKILVLSERFFKYFFYFRTYFLYKTFLSFYFLYDSFKNNLVLNVI